MEINLLVTPSGDLEFVYSDSLRPLFDLGTPEIRRASHVEPTPDGRWLADLTPVAPGVALGPYTTRAEALDAEITWLKEHDLGQS